MPLHFPHYGLAVLTAGSLICMGEQGSSAMPEAVSTVLQENCFKCHGPDKQKGDVRLDMLDPDFINGIHAEDWHDVLDVINFGDMPPKEETPLADDERRALVSWITEELKKAKEAKTTVAGKAIIRRLTRYEYNNTMTDLLGIEMNYAENLPPESKSKDGFENNGMALGISPIQLEYYLDAARIGLAKAIVEGEKPQYFEKTITKGDGPGKKSPYKSHTNGLVFPGQLYRANVLEFPREGEIRVKVLLDDIKVPEGQGYPHMLVELGLRADVISQFATFAEADVIPSKDGGQVELVFTGRIDDMPLPGHNPKFPGISISIINDYKLSAESIDMMERYSKQQAQLAGYKNRKAKAKKQGKPVPKPPKVENIELPEMPSFVVKSVTFEGPVNEVWPPAHHSRILFKQPAGMEEGEYAREVIKRFMTRAFRRPVTDADVSNIHEFYLSIRNEMPSFESAIREALALVLISPDFLYLVEPASEQGTSTELTQHELASRLSYLLWSGMPDAELRSAADQGLLSNPSELEKQTRRMIRDPRSGEFIKHFTGQWLDLSGVDRVAVNPQYYPDFDDKLKEDMKQETIEFFSEILHGDHSAFNLLDSDFLVLNRALAQHYGIPGPMGDKFERVELPGDDPRGGLLTQASVLMMNSNGEDSHPIRRAVWLRTRLLDDPPAPPPPDVPDLNTEDPNFASLPLKRQLELHREKASCNDCHVRIDPWGIPLENYDAIGLWRDEVNRVVNKKTLKSPVVSDAELPGGQKVEGISDLKQVLQKDMKEHFTRGLVRYLLAYSLGRSLDYTDREDVDALQSAFEKSGYQIDELLVEIVKSKPFNTK